MAARLNLRVAAPEAMQAMMALDAYVVDRSGLERSLIELVKTRASQINGCAFCIDMHSRDAIKGGETPQRLLLLNAWREAKGFSDRERAALEWTEVLTLVSERRAPDASYQAVAAQFSQAEVVNLTLLIGAINAWNRLAIGAGMGVDVSKPAS